MTQNKLRWEHSFISFQMRSCAHSYKVPQIPERALPICLIAVCGRSHLFSSLFVTVSWILFDFFSYFKIYFVFPQSILHAGPAFEFIFGCHTAAATKCIFLVVRLRFNRNMFNLRMSNNLDKWARDTCSDTWVIKFDLHRSLASFVLYGVCVPKTTAIQTDGARRRIYEFTAYFSTRNWTQMTQKPTNQMSKLKTTKRNYRKWVCACASLQSLNNN